MERRGSRADPRHAGSETHAREENVFWAKRAFGNKVGWICSSPIHKGKEHPHLRPGLLSCDPHTSNAPTPTKT